MNNDILTLKEWFKRHDFNKDEEKKNYLKLFYSLDKTMKYLHENGYCISSFDINKILVKDYKVQYQNIYQIYDDELIHKNIYYLSCLALGTYNDCLNYINPENKKALRDLYPDFSMFIPDEVKPYYQGIFERDANVYLCDYMEARNKRDIEKLEGELKSLEGNGESNKKNRVMNKATIAGKLFNDDNNVAAFAMLYVFPAIIFLMAILIPIMIILSGK